MDNSVQTEPQKELNDSNPGSYEKFVKKSGKGIKSLNTGFTNALLCLIFLLLFLYPLFSYTSLFTTEHYLQVSYNSEDEQESDSELSDIHNSLKYGGLLKLSMPACEKYANKYEYLRPDIFDKKYKEIHMDANFKYRPYDVVLSFIGNYGWKFIGVLGNRMLFTKTKFRFAN